jgi:cysteine desulfurase
VLAALHVPTELAGGTVRFSFGRESTKEDVDAVIKALPSVVSRVRTLATVLAR